MEIAILETNNKWSAESGDFVLESWGRVLKEEGIVPVLSSELSLTMMRAHNLHSNVTARHLRHWARVVKAQCERGVQINESLRNGFRIVYGGELDDLSDSQDEDEIETVPFVMSVPLGLWDKSASYQLQRQHALQPLWFSLVAFVARERRRGSSSNNNTSLGMLIKRVQHALDQPYLDPSVLESERLEAAIINFCNDATENDWHSRLRWLSALQHAMEMEQSSDHDLMSYMLKGCTDIANFMFQCRFGTDSSLKQISSAIAVLRNRMDLSKYSIPISCTSEHPVLNRHSPDTARFLNLHHAVLMLYRDELKRLEHSRREHAILSCAKDTKTPSTIQLSFLVKQGIVSASRLPLSSLRLLPELLISLDKGANEVCARLLQSKSLGKKRWHEMRNVRANMLRKRNEIWNCLHESTIDVESLRIELEPALLVSTARLQGVLQIFLKHSEFLEPKTIEEIRHTYDRFSQALVRDCVEDGIGMKELKESSLLSILSADLLPMPASNERNYDVLRCVRRALDLITTCSSNIKDEDNEKKELGMFVSSEHRVRLVGALSTLRCVPDLDEMIHTAESLIESVLKDAAREMEKTGTKKRNSKLEACFAISEASLLSSSRKEMAMLLDVLSGNTNSFYKRCNDLIEWGSSSQTRRTLRDVIEWQHLLWRTENGGRVPIFEVQSMWHRASWDCSGYGCLGDSEYTKALTSALYSATHLKLPVEEYRSSVNVRVVFFSFFLSLVCLLLSLSLIHSLTYSLTNVHTHTHTQVLVALQSEIMKIRTSNMSSMKYQDGKLLWCLIRESILSLSEFKDLDLERLHERNEFAKLISTRVKNDMLRKKMNTLLLPCIRLLQEDKNEDSWKRRGEAWTRFGLFQMFVSVPNLPIDPQVPDMLHKWQIDRSLRRAQAVEEIKRLKLILSGGIELDEGDDDDSNVTELQVAKRECKMYGTNLRNMKPSRYRPVDIKFRDLFVSLRSYVKDFGSETRVLNLARRLYEDVATSEEEEHWQQSTARFVTSLSENFELAYCDVVTPVLASIGHVRRGLRILRESARERDEEIILCEVATSLVSFPSSHDPADLAKLALKAASLPKINRNVRRALCKAALETLRERTSYSSREMQALNEASKLCVGLWKQAEEERARRRAEEEKAVEFRERTLEIKTDQEIEDEECREMFPEFTSHYEDLISIEGETKKKKDDDDEKKDVSGLTLEEQRRLVDIMISIGRSKDEDEIEKARVQSFEARFEAARLLMDSITPKLCSNTTQKNMDDMSLGGVFMSTSLNLENMLIPPADANKGLDLHKNFSIHEARLVYPHLESLNQRLEALDAKWPENEVLILLRKLTDRILRTSLRAPLMQIVVGTELLLQRAQNAWEPYATREDRLTNELKPLSLLVRRWRQMQLESWNKLFENEEKRNISNASQWWFHLESILQRIDEEGAGVAEVDVVDETKLEEMSLKDLVRHAESLQIDKDTIEGHKGRKTTWIRAIESLRVKKREYFSWVLYFSPEEEEIDSVRS